MALFGFVFPRPPATYVTISRFGIRIYIDTGHEEIGFVLHNLALKRALSPVVCPLSKLGLNWVCFFAHLNSICLHNYLVNMSLRPCGHSTNWLCFAEKVVKISQISPFITPPAGCSMLCLSAIRSTLNAINHPLPTKRHTIYDTLFVLYLSYSVSNWPSSEFLPIQSCRKNFPIFPVNIQGAGDTIIMMESLPVMCFIVNISVAMPGSTK